MTGVGCALGRFIFNRTQVSFQVFGANPLPWDVNNKTVSFFSHKTAFSVRAQEIKFCKYYGKPFFNFLNIGNLKGPS